MDPASPEVGNRPPDTNSATDTGQFSPCAAESRGPGGRWLGI